LITDFAKFDRPIQMHAAFQALGRFREAHKGELPRPYNSEDAEEVMKLVKEVAAALKLQDFEADEKLIRQFSHIARGDLSPMMAVMGGYTAQEVLKVRSQFIKSQLSFRSALGLHGEIPSVFPICVL
jgi:ubiquitin-activating enzyme E1